jgi:hypothetical protein
MVDRFWHKRLGSLVNQKRLGLNAACMELPARKIRDCGGRDNNLDAQALYGCVLRVFVYFGREVTRQ